MPLERREVPPLYPLTLDASGRSVPDQVRAMIEAGARWVQVRVKRLEDARRFAELEEIVAALPAVVRLIVNDRLDLALAAGADGVHLGDEDLPPGVARRVAGERLVVGFSTHSAEEAVRAGEDPAVDYVAIGPIFASSTKTVRPPLGCDVLREIRGRIPKPLIAIGGIDETNIARVLQAGADSAAVIAAVHRGGAIEENVARLLEAARSAS